MKHNVFLIAIIFILAAGLGILMRQILEQEPQDEGDVISEEKVAPPEAAPQWPPQTNNEGNVEIVITPKNLSSTASSWDFEVEINTHSVELGYDMASISALYDEIGNEYRPISWEGAEPGGHHRSGVLRFNPISPRPKSITLMLRTIGGIAGRRFFWPLEEGEAMTIYVFFNNDKLDPEFSCNKVFAVERVIPKTQEVAGPALTELLRGPTEEEKTQGFFTSIPTGVVIQSLRIENGVAYADFNEALEFQVGGSCRVSAIRAQITETLKQFPTVQQIVISIDGRTEDILQP